MGIPQAYYKIRGTMSNRRGNLPGTEPGPPLKNIADPKNLESPYEAVKTAAEVKQAEDAAPQKIKGIKYLAKIGCGCYDKGEQKITKAMLAGLSDNTESVRLATVEAIAEVAEDEACQKCGSRSCCKKEIVLKMAEMAYERDEFGCYLEPSEDVREAAVAAIAVCCPSSIPVEVIQEDVDRKTEPVPKVEPKKKREPVPDDSTVFDDPAPRPPSSGPLMLQGTQVPQRRVHTSVGDDSGRTGMQLSSFISTGQSDGSVRPAARSSRTTQQAPVNVTTQVTAAPVVSQIDLSNLRGIVEHVDQASGFVKIHVSQDINVPLGTKLNIFHSYLLGESRVGQLEVVHSAHGTVSARTVDRGPLRQVARGDKARVAK